MASLQWINFMLLFCVAVLSSSAHRKWKQWAAPRALLILWQQPASHSRGSLLFFSFSNPPPFPPPPSASIHFCNQISNREEGGGREEASATKANPLLATNTHTHTHRGSFFLSTSLRHDRTDSATRFHRGLMPRRPVSKLCEKVIPSHFLTAF